MRGLARIMNTPDDIQKLLDLYPSKHNGITFCQVAHPNLQANSLRRLVSMQPSPRRTLSVVVQGTFSEMGVDIPSTIRRFGERIYFVHFRDVCGHSHDFVETFQVRTHVTTLIAFCCTFHIIFGAG